MEDLETLSEGLLLALQVLTFDWRSEVKRCSSA